MTLTVNFVITAIAFLVDRRPVLRRAALEPGRRPAARRLVTLADRPALWLDRRHRRLPVRHLVLSRHRGHVPGGRGGALAGPLAAFRHHGGHDHAADRRVAHLVRLPRACCPGNISARPTTPLYDAARVTGTTVLDVPPVRRHPVLGRRVGQRLHQRRGAGLVLDGPRPLHADLVRRPCTRTTARPTARSCS